MTSWATVMSRAGMLVLAALLLSGCTSKLPGPLECEKMVYQALGRTPQELGQSPLALRVTNRLVHGCLTVPFDRETVQCIEKGYGFVRCTEELADRAPARRRALSRLSGDLNALLPRERGVFFR